MAKQVRNVDEINAQLATLSSQIYPGGLTLMYVAVDQIREQEINAQTMPQKMFDQLSENIKASGAVESVPLCAKVDDAIYMISGHHRLRAARSAGLTHILILLYTTITKSRVRSKQLSHNSITGKSDPELVKRIWQEITDVQAKFEAFIDPRQFDAIPEPVQFKPVDVDMLARSKSVLLLFLPSQKDKFDAVLEAILPKSKLDAVYLADRESFDAWKAAVQRVRADVEVVNIATAIVEMSRLAVEALDSRRAMKEEQESDQPS